MNRTGFRPRHAAELTDPLVADPRTYFLVALTAVP